MNITNDTTLNLPPDGIFHCTTITVAAGATLRFNRNPLNTPLYLLATGDVQIDGTVNVSGSGPSGGPGGFDGGYAPLVYEGYQRGGDGFGPGGGIGAAPDYFANGTFGYGNSLLNPLIGGSGGAGISYNGLHRGGGGGGAILIASNTRITISGVVRSGGGFGGMSANYGSGGAIRLLAPVVSGNGSLDTFCREPGAPGYQPGRVRIDCTDFLSWRNLSIPYGTVSRGSRMVVFPAVIPRLDIIEVAGNAIPEGTNNAVSFELSVGAPTNQTVKVQARGFTNDLPIRVVVTPENLASAQFDAVILQSSGNPPSAVVPVIIPAGHISYIYVWTR